MSPDRAIVAGPFLLSRFMQMPQCAIRILVGDRGWCIHVALYFSDRHDQCQAQG
jgi:hypothetical protein